MAESPQDPDSTCLSFSNPNYSFEDRVNSNLKARNLIENGNDISSESEKTMGLKTGINSDAEKSNAYEDIWKVTVSKDGSCSDSEDSDEDFEDRNLIDVKGDENELDEVTYVDDSSKSGGFLSYYTLLEAKAKQQALCSDGEEDEDTEEELTPSRDRVENKNEYKKSNTDIYSPDSNDSGIQSDDRSDESVTHTPCQVNGDIYSVGEKQNVSRDHTPTQECVDAWKDNSSDILPPGWQRHEDEDGPYFWHIKSGTIQREPPSPAPPEMKLTLSSAVSVPSDHDSSTLSGNGSIPSTPSSVTSSTSDHLQEFEGHALQYAAKSLQSLTDNMPSQDNREPRTDEKPMRFAVRSLGWVSIAEEDLTPERSSKAVNKCIVDLSLGRNDFNDAVGRWGDGKDLYLDLDSQSLRIIDPVDFTLLNSQAIASIRVWGVGRDNGRDFAYVARDKATKKHMCHVFRCDTPARHIANALRDICKKLMVEKQLQNSMNRLNRPTDLPNLSSQKGQKHSFQSLYNNAQFPTPMEEPKKVIRCHYLGTDIVFKPTGMDVLNQSIDRVYSKVPPEKWVFVNVAVAPSTITIVEHGKPDNKLDECRVRFLSFMGIGATDVRLCAFIIHNAEDKFVAHVFHCDPTGGPLCKTIEAACKLRYQKCLDSHQITPTKSSQKERISETLKAGVKAGVQNIKGLFKMRRNEQC